MLKIKKLTVQYGPLPALNEVSLEVKQGEIVSLLGPNGAGKTTLLLTLSGILKTTEGRIIFKDEDITNLSPPKIVFKGIGHVPQGRHIFPTLSVIDNLLMGAYLHRNEKKEIKKDLERVDQFLPVLKERAHQRAGTLSGGEQQMLSIGRAMMGRPKLLLLDEPSLGLAPRLMDEVFATFREMNKGGLTLFIVEQEIQLTLAISNRGYLLRNGRVIKEASASALTESREVKALYLGEDAERGLK
ncbi:MAG: ABC transporter ATP-binding protein [Thermodesulfobacteriota bacterium]|jgi:branched-chain amino acid transport system ATP-binding protein